MSRYRIAMVQFDGGSRTYPVNCASYSMNPGERVIVRMTSQPEPKQLQRAKIVEITDGRKPCKNGIVCREDQADAYGRGPAGVSTAADLERFLGFLNWPRFSSPWSDETIGSLSAPLEKWRAVYLIDFRPSYSDDGKFYGPGTLIAVGQEDVARARHGQWGFVQTSEQKIIVPRSASFLSFSLGDHGKNPFQRAAEFLDRDFALDMDPPDNSLSEIRDAISGGGPAYLSDDVSI